MMFPVGLTITFTRACVEHANEALGTAFIGAGGVLDSLTTVTGELDPSLKYDLTGDAPIVLVPQPSDDPNDPLVSFFSSRLTNMVGSS